MKNKLENAKDFALDNIDIIGSGILTVVIAVGCYVCYSQGVKVGVNTVVGCLEAAAKAKSE